MSTPPTGETESEPDGKKRAHPASSPTQPSSPAAQTAEALGLPQSFGSSKRARGAERAPVTASASTVGSGSGSSSLVIGVRGSGGQGQGQGARGGRGGGGGHPRDDWVDYPWVKPSFTANPWAALESRLGIKNVWRA